MAGWLLIRRLRIRPMAMAVAMAQRGIRS